MSFNTYGFLLAFLPITLIIYWWMRKKGKDRGSVLLLILASLIFCAFSSLSGLCVLILSLLVNYTLIRKIENESNVACEVTSEGIPKGTCEAKSEVTSEVTAQVISKDNSKIILVIGIIFNILLLALVKYGPVVWPRIGDTIKAPGISFYSFCEIALLVEVYRGTTGRFSALEYGFFITFFPKMLQGPITLPSDFLNQKPVKSIGLEKIYRLLLLFSFGMFKKVIIADTLGKAVNFGFNSLNSMHTGEALVIMLSYTLQLYFDFSGYCDMAVAIAGLFGYELPINFNSPYKAVNIDDFWKRWHISLTRFFTRYIYIPLGGNRKGKARTYFNFFIIFLISGLWHGAGLQFIIWGLMHGVLYIFTRIVADRKSNRKCAQKATDVKSGVEKRAQKAADVKSGVEKLAQKATDVKNGIEKPTDMKSERTAAGLKDNPIMHCLKVLMTFLYVNVAWVFFRAPSVEDALHLFKDMAECWFPRFNKDLANCFNIDEFWYVIKILHLDKWTYGIYILMFVILALCLVLVFFAPTAAEFSQKCKINIATTVVMAVIIAWCILSFEGVATYLYVNF